MPGAIAYPLTGLYTVARTGKGSIVNGAGSFEELANDTPRFTFEAATLLPLGLRIEEQRTNQMRNPRAEGGSTSAMPTFWSDIASAASALGLTFEKLGLVSVAGMPGFRYRLNGTTTAAGALAIVFDTGTGAQSKIYTGSLVHRVLSGSMANCEPVLRTRAMTAGFTQTAGGQVALDAAPGAPRRYAHTFTVPADGANVTTQTRLMLQWAFGANQLVEFVGEVFLPQLEEGDCATSPILPLAGSPGVSTRPADAVSITDLSKIGWCSQGMSVIWAGRIDAAAYAGGAIKGLWKFDNGQSDQSFCGWVSPSDGTVRLQITIDGLSYYALAPGGAVTPGQDFTVRAAFGPGVGRISLNGGAVAEVAGIPAGAVPFNLSRLKQGVQGGGFNSSLNGTMRSFVAIPGTASAAELPTLAA